MSTVMTNLADAITDYRQVMLSGENTSLEEVAEAYNINPKLLERKFNESYPNGVGQYETLENTIELTFNENVERACKKYNVPLNNVMKRNVRGVDYALICYLSNTRVRPYVAVSAKDGKVYRLSF